MTFRLLTPRRRIAVAVIGICATLTVVFAFRVHASSAKDRGVNSSKVQANVASTGCMPYAYLGGLKYRRFLVLIPVNVRLNCRETRPAVLRYLRNLRDYFRTDRCSGSGCTNAPSLPGWSCALAKPTSRYPYVKCRTRGQEAWAIAPK